MPEQKDLTSKKPNNTVADEKKKSALLVADSSKDRLQIFSATADGKSDNIATFNPQQAPSIKFETKPSKSLEELEKAQADAKKTPLEEKLATETSFIDEEYASEDVVNEAFEFDLKADKSASAEYAKKTVHAADELFEDDMDPVLRLSPEQRISWQGAQSQAKLWRSAAVMATALWMGFSLYYFLFSLGLERLSQASLFELGGLLGMTLMPVALLWTIINNTQRKNDVMFYADTLKSELHSILFPTEARAQAVHQDIEQLVEQSAELAASSKAVLKSIHRARHGLRTELREFLTLTKKGEAHMETLKSGLEKSVRDTAALITDIEKRVEIVGLSCKSGVSEWDKAVGDLVKRGESVREVMDKGAASLLDAAKKVTSEATIIQNSFGDKVTSMTDRVGVVTEQLDTISIRFEDNLARVEAAANKVYDSNDDLSETLEGQIDTLGSISKDALTQLSESKAALSLQTEAFVKGTEALGRQTSETTIMLNEKVSELYMVADHIGSEFEGFEGRVNTQAGKLSESVTGLNTFLSKIETTGDEAIHKLTEAVSSALTTTETMHNSVRKSVDTIRTATTQAKTQAEELLEVTEAQSVKLSAKEKAFAENVAQVTTVFDDSFEQLESVYARGDKLVLTIEEKTKLNAEALDLSANVLQTTLTQMSAKVRDPLDEISGAIKDISKAEEVLEGALKKRVDELLDTTGKTVDAAQKVKDTLKGQAQEIASLTGQISGQTQSVEETLNAQQRLLKTLVEDNAKTMETAVDSFKTQTVSLGDVCKVAEDRFDGLNTRISSSFQNLKHYQSDTFDGLDTLSTKLEERAGDIARMKKHVLEDLETITIRLSETIDQNRPQYKDMLVDAQSVQEKLEDLNGAVRESFDLTLEKMKDTGSTFKENVVAVKAQSEEAHQSLLKVNQDLVMNKETVVETLQEVEERTTSALREFEDRAGDIHLTVDQATIKIEKVQKSMKDQLATLSDYVGQSVSFINSAEDSFARASDMLSTRIKDAQGAYAGLRQTVKDEGDVLLQMTETTLQKTKGTVSSLISETKDLVSSSEQSLSNLKQIGDSISVRVMEIDKQMQVAQENAGKYGMELREQMSAVADASFNATDRIAVAISDLNTKSQGISEVVTELNSDITRAGQTLKSHARDLKIVSEAAVSVSNDATSNFSEHTVKLQKATEGAMDQVQKIREATLRFQRDSFLSSAKFLMESLHSLSVDIIRHVKGGDMEEKDMRAYEKGDLTVFTKRLLEIGDKFPEAMVREKFSADNEFRTYVQRYMRQFEELFEQAQENDHGGIMTATFIASDIGKVYLLLCKATGRTPRGVIKH